LQAVLTFSLDADLRSVYSWNTKQLFVFLQVSGMIERVRMINFVWLVIV
jgi:hypothetical protein